MGVCLGSNQTHLASSRKKQNDSHTHVLTYAPVTEQRTIHNLIGVFPSEKNAIVQREGKKNFTHWRQKGPDIARNEALILLCQIQHDGPTLLAGFGIRKSFVDEKDLHPIWENTAILT